MLDVGADVSDRVAVKNTDGWRYSLLKLIYLAKRRPGFTFDDFIRRWRMHGARGMQQPIWRHALGYVQAEPIRPVPVAGASDEYDAVACFMLDDQTFSDFDEADVAAAGAMAEDELETFSAPIPAASLWVHEERLEDGELGGVSAYLFFADSERAADVAQRIRSADGLNRIVLNRRRDDGPLGPGANTLPYDAVVELSACNLLDLRAAIESRGGELLSEAEVAVVTRDAVLWNRLPR